MDVFANEIRWLAGLARFEGPYLEHIVKLTFINGLPDYMSVQLQQVRDILGSSLAEILTIVRVLTAHKATSGAVAAVATNGRPSWQEGRERASQTPPPGRERVSKTPPPGSGGFRGKCFECGGAPHGTILHGENSKSHTVLSLWAGGRHIAVYCGKGQGQGNEQGETAAPAVIRPQE